MPDTLTDLTLPAHTPATRDRLWKRHGAGSAWAWTDGRFTHTPAPKSGARPFTLEVGDGPGQLAAIHFVRGRLVTGQRSVVINHYAPVNADGRQVGPLMWYGAPDRPTPEACFPNNAVIAFLAHHPAKIPMRHTTVPSLADFTDRYPQMAEVLMAAASRNALARRLRP